MSLTPRILSFSALAIAGMLLFSPLAQAQETRIAYFLLDRVVSELDDAKAAFERLESDFNAKQRQFDQRRQELERMARDFEQKAAVYSQAQKEQVAQEIQMKAQEAQRLMYELQNQQMQQNEMVVAELMNKLEPVVKEVAARQKYTHVFEKQQSGLFVAPTGDDLTSEVIRAYNIRYGKKPAGKDSSKKGSKK